MDMRFLWLILICRIFSLSQANETATNNTQATVSHARCREEEEEEKKKKKKEKLMFNLQKQRPD